MIDLAGELGVKIGANDIARLAQIDTLLLEMRLGRIGLDQMVARYVHSLRKDHTVSGLTERFKDICCAHVPHHVVALPGANELLAELDRRGIAHAVLTNGWSPLQELKAEAIGYQGPVLVSDTIGVAKPSIESFERLARELPDGASRWYVGDNPASDVRGSLDAGYSAIWYHEHAGVSYPEPSPAADGGDRPVARHRRAGRQQRRRRHTRSSRGDAEDRLTR